MIMDSLYFKEFIDKNEIIVIDKNNLMILNLLNGKIKKNIKINTNFSNLEFISNEKSLLFKNSGKYNDIYELNLKKNKKRYLFKYEDRFYDYIYNPQKNIIGFLSKEDELFLVDLKTKKTRRFISSSFKQKARKNIKFSTNGKKLFILIDAVLMKDKKGFKKYLNGCIKIFNLEKSKFEYDIKI